MPVYSTTLRAILMFTAGMAFFSAMNITIRLISDDMPTPLIVFLRSIMSLFVVVAWAGYLQKGIPTFPTKRLRNHFMRATIGLVSMELWFYSVTIMPVTLATALSFTTPIFTTIAALLFLGERAGMRRWAAIIVGFVGMLIILRPGVSGMSANAMIVLASSIMMAITGILVKTLTRTEAPETIIFYMALFMIPWATIGGVYYWQDITLYQLWAVFLIAIFSTTAHLCMTRAFAKADMVVLMPFDFTRLIFTAVMAYLAFEEVMDFYTVAGSLLIVSSTVYIAHREATVKKRASPAIGEANDPIVK